MGINESLERELDKHPGVVSFSTTSNIRLIAGRELIELTRNKDGKLIDDSKARVEILETFVPVSIFVHSSKRGSYRDTEYLLDKDLFLKVVRTEQPEGANAFETNYSGEGVRGEFHLPVVYYRIKRE